MPHVPRDHFLLDTPQGSLTRLDPWFPGDRTTGIRASVRDVEVELLGGGELATEGAWVSERFGERVPTTASVARTQLELPASIGFRLRCLQ